MMLGSDPLIAHPSMDHNGKHIKILNLSCLRQRWMMKVINLAALVNAVIPDVDKRYRRIRLTGFK